MQVNYHGDSRGPIRNDFTPQGRLRLEQKALADSIAALAAQASEGRVEGTEALSELAARKAAVDKQLSEAESEAQRQEKLETQRRLARLPSLIAEAQAQRAKFIELHRAACVALGEYCRMIGIAADLTNLESRTNTMNYSPHRNEVGELLRAPAPLSGLQYTPVAHIGFNWQIPVVPIHAELKEDK
jgi:hypothetical protein